MLAGLSRIEKIGLIALSAAGLFATIDLTLATVPIAMLLLIFLAAPFVHQLGFFIPVISNGSVDRPAVALTFDDGPDPDTTPALLELLERLDVTATFFVVGRRVATHPALVKQIMAQGHAIGNHGFHHDPLAPFKGAGRAVQEIVATQKALAPLGVAPLIFRPPVGITYPAMGRALAELNMVAVTFSCRAWDRGNRSVSRIARRILRRVRPGDIIMLHDRVPPQRSDTALWLGQVAAVVSGIRERGLTIVPLEELIDRPVDQRIRLSE